MASVIMFALPILDTALAFARRYVNRRPLFAADRHHFHHQMVARGFTIKQTVLISYLLAIFFAVAGGSVVYIRTRYVVAFYLVIFGSIIVAAYKMGMVHEKPRVVQRKPLGTFEAMAAVPPQAIEPNSVIEVSDAAATR
jgi:UDP-GlcNAc:undecaprenyl-phosphate/decaprenyl-phosphate GlcNAc-1-phosphate transferase